MYVFKTSNINEYHPCSYRSVEFLERDMDGYFRIYFDPITEGLEQEKSETESV